jgi:hypothetical protein
MVGEMLAEKTMIFPLHKTAQLYKLLKEVNFDEEEINARKDLRAIIQKIFDDDYDSIIAPVGEKYNMIKAVEITNDGFKFKVNDVYCSEGLCNG